MTAATPAPDEPGASNPAPGRDGEQRYLIGDTLFLRGLELGDAAWATAWRPSPFPISARQAEEQLRKLVPGQQGRRIARLVACRRDDGRPVGSVLVDDSEATESVVVLHADPALGPRGADLQAEMLALVVPWLSAERQRPVVRLATDAGLAPVMRRAEALEMRPAARLRDGVWRDGALHDRIFLDLLHPAWVERLGDPGPGIAEAGEPILSPRAPAPRRDPDAALPLPPNALIGSERLALRPFQVEDAATVTTLLRREPDASFGHSRFPYSPIAFSEGFGEIGAHDPPEELELAVVLRETGELFGEVGLYGIDWLARSAETGSWIYRAEQRGAGYGTEAKRLLLEYAFDRLGLHMLWSWVKSRNPRSQAALRKQGYRDAGRLSWTNFGPDGFEDARMFDLLAHEWRGG
ncbi:MAG: GNAT family N-acetyltransferase [Thermomicrobiales bacterium]|nr:GNAT family N-acetyltransferase [Thermomicrobiales bacterium]